MSIRWKILSTSSTNKIKLLTISDHPLVSSGVGSQTKYIIEGLLKTGRYTVRSLGGAMKHEDYRPLRIEDYGDDWMIYPVDGYGDPQMIRQVLDHEKPDAIWFMTDPRFYIWLFQMSDEIRDRGVPLLYYNVWDNYPVPVFNKPFYDSCDFVGCISKLTHNILRELGNESKSEYIPHAVDAEIFKPLPKEEVLNKRVEMFGADYKDKFIVFYNSRNARRKMTSDVVKSFKQLSDKVGKDNVFLFMHTDPHDQEGADLFAVADMLKLSHSQIRFSRGRVDPVQMNVFYNIADVTINISNNEGFGLSSLESLFSGTPVISNRTGGLQDQNIDKDTGEQYGVSIVPATTSLQGSQQIPYIFDDRCSDEDVLNALLKMYNLGFDERKKIGARASRYACENFKMSDMVGKWDAAITKYVEQFREHGYSGRVKLKKI